MKRNIYKLVSSAKQELFALALTIFSGTAYSQATYTFNFTGTVQTISLPAGNYSIAMWGADGGNGTNSPGGKGGYSQGTLTVGSAANYYIYVGGAGISGAAATAGGWNGGGTLVGSFTSPTVCGSGGGGTDIRTIQNTTYANRIIVAGGGGGGNGYGAYTGVGGNGGGSAGQDGASSRGQTYAGGGATAAAGGTAATGGIVGYSQPGGLGIGGDYTGTLGGTAGGGGYYGGGSGHWGGSGGGGSGYLGGVTNGTSAQLSQPGFVTKPIVAGDGLVLITELCNITLMASTANSLNPAICSGQSLTLTTNAISNYSWSTGATSSSLVVSPTTNTVYSLTATSPSNCTASKTISVTVSSAQPTLSVVSSTNQTCLGKTATLTASGAVTYTWSNSVTNGVSFYPSSTTTYTVIGQNGCGTVSAVSTISVVPISVTAASSATAVCTNKTATLSITAAANSYTWNPGNVTGTSPNLIVNPQVTTIYTTIASDGTCSGTATVSVVANPVPTITSSSSSTIVCPGGTINLSATGGINYTWTPVNLNGSSISVSPTASTLYNVVGDNTFGCLGNSSQVIVVGTQPTVIISSSSSTICGGTSATLTASGANTYAWTGGPTTTVYVVSPTQLSTYTIVGTNSSSGCTDTKTVMVDVYTPVIAITGNTAVCDGEATNLTASGAGGYVWNPGNLPFASIAVTPNSNTTYTVNGIGTSGTLNCPVIATVQVIVNPNPTVTAASTPTAICPKETTTITASGAITYTWVGASTTTVGTSIQASSPNVAVLVYTLTGVSTLGCLSSITVPVTIHACTGIEQLASLSGGSEQLTVYPNPAKGDFTIRSGVEMNLILINELGQVIKKIQLDEKNNYKVSISDMSSGIYFIVGNDLSRKIIVSN